MLFTLATNLSFSVLLTATVFITLRSSDKSLGSGVNLSVYSLSTSVFKLAKFYFSAKLLASTFIHHNF